MIIYDGLINLVTCLKRNKIEVSNVDGYVFPRKSWSRSGCLLSLAPFDGAFGGLFLGEILRLPQ